MKTIKLMSFNVLTSAKKDAEIYERTLLREERLGPTFAMLRELHPDVIGLQEVSDVHRERIENNPDLKDYGIVGSPAKPILHEQGVYIMFDQTKYELVRWGIKWLSETPEAEHSYIREAEKENRNRLELEKGIMHQPRKAVYVILRDREDGTEFGFCDTHLGHTPVGSRQEISDLIRYRQANILVNLIQEGKLFEKGMAFAIVGDMNSQPYMEPHKEFLKITEDVRDCAEIRPDITQKTLHGYKKENRENQIDYIFISKNSFKCHKFEVITKPYYSEPLKRDILPSDHYALMAEVSFLQETIHTR